MGFGILSCESEEAVRCCGPEHHNANRLRESGEFLEMRETDWGEWNMEEIHNPFSLSNIYRGNGCVSLRALKGLQHSKRWYVTDNEVKVKVTVEQATKSQRGIRGIALLFL